MSINNINSKNSINKLSERLGLIQADLDTNSLDEIDRIARIPILERMFIEIKAETLGLETKLAILGDDFQFAKDAELVGSNLASLKKTKAVWEGIYHNCIRAQLSLFTQICNKTEIDLITKQQTFPQITSKQHQALKRIRHELNRLNSNEHLTEDEQRTVASCLSQVEKLLPQLKEQNENDLAKALVVVQKPFVQEIQDPSAANIGRFIPCSNEILLHLLSFLSPEDLAHLSSCSTFFRNLCEDDSIWKSILQREFPSLIRPDNKSAKEIYISHKAMINGLKNGLYTSSTLLESKSSVIRIFLEGSLLFEAKKMLKVWDLKNNSPIATLDTEGRAYCLHKQGDLLISGSGKGKIKIWDLSNLNNIHSIVTFTGDQQGILSIHKGGDLLFSAGFFGEKIEVWDLSNLNNIHCIATLTGDQGVIRSLLRQGNCLFSGGEGKIKIWDLSDLNNIHCTATLKIEENKSVHCLLNEGNLLFATVGNEIKIWDLASNTCVATMIGHQREVSCVAVEGNFLFSGSCDRTIKIWDLTTKQCIGTLRGHRMPIAYIKKEGNQLFSGSCMNTINIKAWNLNVNLEDTLFNLIDVIKDVPKNNLSETQSESLEIFLERIKNLSPLIRNQIYGELYEIQTFKKDGCAEHAFLETNGLQSTCEKKIEAIHRYLLKCVIKLFKNGNSEKALDLFSKLPSEIKSTIYGIFYKNNKFKNYQGCAEKVFLNLSSQKIADEKKIEAIEEFLNDTKIKR